MKKWIALLLLLAVLAVPAFGAGNLVCDGEHLLSEAEAAALEQCYSQYTGFTPILVTTDSFDGLSAGDYAGDFYDANGYPQDGILLLVSLTEGQWYILTNGACYRQISDRDAERMGDTLVPMIRQGDYYEAFREFPALAEKYMEGAAANGQSSGKPYGTTIAICMGVGLLIGLITVGIMAARMRSVKLRGSASDYVRPGSMQITNSRDLYLYSHVTRTPRPKNNSSGGSSHGGGGSRGGAGGRL